MQTFLQSYSGCIYCIPALLIVFICWSESSVWLRIHPIHNTEPSWFSLCLGFEINWNKSSTQPLQWVECWRSCSAHSFAAGAAWRHSDIADYYTGAGVHSSGSSGGTTGVATHATPAKMDARRGTSGALDCSPSSMQGDVCCWGGGLVQESGGGSVHRPMLHLLPAMVFSGTSGWPTLGRAHVPWPKKLFCAFPPLRLTPP